jgi:hypothetical protein
MLILLLLQRCETEELRSWSWRSRGFVLRGHVELWILQCWDRMAFCSSKLEQKDQIHSVKFIFSSKDMRYWNEKMSVSCILDGDELRFTRRARSTWCQTDKNKAVGLSSGS